jgi:hypothetical protein
MAAGHQHHRAGRRQTNDTQPLLATADGGCIYSTEKRDVEDFSRKFALVISCVLILVLL